MLSVYIKMFGHTRASDKEPWRDVICYVTFTDATLHRSIVEDSFRYYLGLDLEYIERHHRDHFTEPHNVARAILLYHYFRDRHQFFRDQRFEYVGSQQVPQRPADAAGDGYELWVDSTAEEEA
jgi:hypothetical protein